MNEKIEVPTMKVPPLKKICMTIGQLPASYVESMSYYEMLVWFVHYLRDDIIPVVNANGEATKELQELYVELQEYVNNYFDNLDVQEEINNKLDEMVEDGTLQEIITDYLNSKAIFSYDTVADMIQATNLIDGSYAKTLGYYSIGDYGDCIYKISETSTNDIRSIELDNGLYAIAQLDLIVIGNKLGLHNDKTTDDSTNLQNIINFCKNNDRELILKGIIYVANTIDTKGIKISGVGTPSNAQATYTSESYGYLEFDYLRNVNDGALITFNDYLNDVIKTGTAIVSDTANPILKCKHEDGKFKLENLCICGWLRNTNNQEGILSTYESDDDEYLDGHHIFKNVNVINCSGNGIHLQSLENTIVENLQSNFNFGIGLYIEGVDNHDTPFEYVDLINCKFNGNKLGGLYAHNCYRKQVRFIRCQSNSSGLYNQLGLDLPLTTDELIYGFKIDGKESSKDTTREILIFDNCYGEETNKLIEILANTSSDTYILNKVSIYNCVAYPYGVSGINCLLNFKTYFTNNFSYYDNLFNGANPLFVTVGNHLTTQIVDQYFYNAWTNVPNFTLNSKITPITKYIKRYGNIIKLDIRGTINAGSTIAAYESIATGLPHPTENTPILMDVGTTQIALATLYPNGTIGSNYQLNENVDVCLTLTYFVPPDYDLH